MLIDSNLNLSLQKSEDPIFLRQRGCIIIRFFAIHPLFACSENSMVSGGGVFAVFPKYAILGE